jgi:hypothetical protein
MQEVGLYPIISTDSLYDGMINLNTFFTIAGAVILINVACLELNRPPDLPEWPRQSAEPTPPWWSNAQYYESLWWTWCSVPDAPLIFNDIAEIIPIMTIFMCIVVLCDASTRIVLG